jgi:serine/threonine-protein kinase
MEIIKSPQSVEYTLSQELYSNSATKRSFYKVRNSELGTYYGLKVIELETPREIKQVRNEIALLNRLPFGMTAKCHQFWSRGNKHYLILDWIEGIPLSNFFKAVPVSKAELKQRLEAIEMLGRELSNIHRYKVLHRDIKPENVIVQHRNNNIVDVKLIDFGLSNQRRGFEEGTVNYGSPEQSLSRDQNLTPASDIFSMNQLLYFLLMGKPLCLNPNFDHSDWENGINLELPAFCPKTLTSILENGLAFNPKKRTQQVQTFINNIRKIKHKL